jgi:hypothetical protein
LGITAYILEKREMKFTVPAGEIGADFSPVTDIWLSFYKISFRTEHCTYDKDLSNRL